MKEEKYKHYYIVVIYVLKLLPAELFIIMTQVGDKYFVFSSMASKQLISAVLRSVLSHTEKSCIIAYFYYFQE